MTESLFHVLKVMPPGIVSRFYQVVVTVYSETNTTQSELKFSLVSYFLPILRHLESNPCGMSLTGS